NAGMRRPRRFRVGDTRQVNLEHGAAADFAVHFNMTAALLDDAVDRGQAQARALADFLGREEWLENLRAHRLSHAAAAVAYDQHYERTGRRFGMLPGKRRAQLHLTGFDGETPSRGHGIAGVVERGP